jgi:Cu-Zn family superoxide dismutase
MTRTFRILAACGAAALATGGLAAQASAEEKAAPASVRADVIGLDGKSLGTVTLQETPSGVLVATDLKGLPPGDHGFHFHEKGICEPEQKFTTAGAHFAGGGHMHGLMASGTPHGGDMPNQHVGADGTLKVQVLNTGVSLGTGGKSLVDADGSAFVIHADADDYTSQPAGNAGGRIACAVVSAPQ